MITVKYSTEQNRYELYEKRSPSQYVRRCIDNTVTGSNKCTGYCQYSGHPGFLTYKHQKEHNCIEKQCFYYLEKPKREKSTTSLSQDMSEYIFARVKKIMIDNEFVRILRVENTKYHQYTAFYVTITNECGFENCISDIQQELGVELEFVKLDYDFDKCVALLYAG